MGTDGLSTQNPCEVESVPHDVNTSTATQDTTILPRTPLHFHQSMMCGRGTTTTCSVIRSWMRS